jgi:uncharacterized protein YrrD
MQNNEYIKRWTELRGLPIVIISQGRKAGTLEDFYFDPGTNEVYALRLKTGFFGYKALLSSAINAIGKDAITINTEEMLTEEKHDGRLPVLPLGESLLSYKVMSEKGNVVGNVGNILIDTSRPVALRITAFELSGGLRDRITGHYPTFSANEIVRYGEDVIVIIDQAAKRL